MSWGRLSVIFKNPAPEAKVQLVFLFAPKHPFGELFSKIAFKSSSEFSFWRKIRKFEIGQNVPNLQILSGFQCIFTTLVEDNENLCWIHFFISRFSSFWIGFHYILPPTKLSFYCIHPRKVHYILYSFCTLNFAIFQTTITSIVQECTWNKRVPFNEHFFVFIM